MTTSLDEFVVYYETAIWLLSEMVHCWQRTSGDRSLEYSKKYSRRQCTSVMIYHSSRDCDVV